MLRHRDNSPKGVRRSAGLTAVGVGAIAAWLGYVAVRAEITGDASDLALRSRRVAKRDTMPREFRQYANRTWAATGFCALASMVSLGFYRKLGE
jgi:hypothetical protein